MHALEAVEMVLREVGGPLHYKEITERILRRKLWTPAGKTPAATVNSRLAVDLQERGVESRFLRVAPGTFALRSTAPREGADGGKSSGPAQGAALALAAEATGKKLTRQEIRNLARQIVKSQPGGIRYGQLLASIVDQYPATPRNTVVGSIWNLDAVFPTEIHKPSRGIFKLRPEEGGSDQDEAEPTLDLPLTEDAFYEPFADWLKNDAGDATEAIAFGGAALGRKWGTPDVIGIYKPSPSNRIQFAKEIVAAEIKIDPHAPVVAFGQAVAYRLFSTKTYIVMPRTIAEEDLDRLEALCMLFGVGLVLFTLNPEQPDFTIRMRAQRFSPDMYFVNDFADALHRHDHEIFNRLFQ